MNSLLLRVKTIVAVCVFVAFAAVPASAGAVAGTSTAPGGSQISYALDGANFVLKSANPVKYGGTYSGGAPITISGSIIAAVPGGGDGYATASAAIGVGVAGASQWTWPADRGADPTSVERFEGTATTSFSLSHTLTAADRAKGEVVGVIAVSACAWSTRACDSTRVDFTLKLGKPTPPPTVKAWKIDKILRIGKRYAQPLAVTDKSGKAQIVTDLYEGGTLIGTAKSPGLVKAKGQVRNVFITPTAERKGPLEFCVWATNASGATSRKAPRSACKWVDVLVPIKNVSNQCGGAGWDKVVEFQNWIGNTSSFYDSGLGESFTVDFTEACNLHDAGYGGHTVRDILAGKRGDRPIVNFRLWSRSEVDTKFLKDMRKLCVQQIPKRAAVARRDCERGRGRYNAVRLVGGHFFDADLRTPGTQSEGHRRNDGPFSSITWLS